MAEKHYAVNGTEGQGTYVDMSNEVEARPQPSPYVEVGDKNRRGVQWEIGPLRFNPIVTFFSVVIIWSFIGAVIADPESADGNFTLAKVTNSRELVGEIAIFVKPRMLAGDGYRAIEQSCYFEIIPKQ